MPSAKILRSHYALALIHHKIGLNLLSCLSAYYAFFLCLIYISHFFDTHLILHKFKQAVKTIYCIDFDSPTLRPASVISSRFKRSLGFESPLVNNPINVSRKNF